ncbi:uncharacterized protein [Channa argus]|uniref:uncharacterized protein n=1 Tax=Channa argus TaxID=215402 RepID=UPI003522587A
MPTRGLLALSDDQRPVPTRACSSPLTQEAWIPAKRRHRTTPAAANLVNQSIGPPSPVQMDNRFTVLEELESPTSPVVVPCDSLPREIPHGSTSRGQRGRGLLLGPRQTRRATATNTMPPERNPHAPPRGTSPPHRPPGPTMLIIGDSIVREVRLKSAKTFCFPGAAVTDIAEKIPNLIEKHTTATKVVIHVGTNDTKRQQSELVKRDFVSFFNSLESFHDRRFFISSHAGSQCWLVLQTPQPAHMASTTRTAHGLTLIISIFSGIVLSTSSKMDCTRTSEITDVY